MHKRVRHDITFMNQRIYTQHTLDSHGGGASLHGIERILDLDQLAGWAGCKQPRQRFAKHTYAHADEQHVTYIFKYKDASTRTDLKVVRPKL